MSSTDELEWLMDLRDKQREALSIAAQHDPYVADYLAQYDATIAELTALRQLADELIAIHEHPEFDEVDRDIRAGKVAERAKELRK